MKMGKMHSIETSIFIFVYTAISIALTAGIVEIFRSWSKTHSALVEIFTCNWA
jgi:hypothetical protein